MAYAEYIQKQIPRQQHRNAVPILDRFLKTPCRVDGILLLGSDWFVNRVKIIRKRLIWALISFIKQTEKRLSVIEALSVLQYRYPSLRLHFQDTPDWTQYPAAWATELKRLKELDRKVQTNTIAPVGLLNRFYRPPKPFTNSGTQQRAETVVYGNGNTVNVTQVTNFGAMADNLIKRLSECIVKYAKIGAVVYNINTLLSSSAGITLIVCELLARSESVLGWFNIRSRNTVQTILQLAKWLGRGLFLLLKILPEFLAGFVHTIDSAAVSFRSLLVDAFESSLKRWTYTKEDLQIDQLCRAFASAEKTYAVKLNDMKEQYMKAIVDLVQTRDKIANMAPEFQDTFDIIWYWGSRIVLGDNRSLPITEEARLKLLAFKEAALSSSRADLSKALFNVAKLDPVEFPDTDMTSEYLKYLNKTYEQPHSLLTRAVRATREFTNTNTAGYINAFAIALPMLSALTGEGPGLLLRIMTDFTTPVFMQGVLTSAATIAQIGQSVPT